MKRDLYDLTHELECLSSTTAALGWAVKEGFGQELDLTNEAIAKQIWMIGNAIDRITADLEKIEEISHCPCRFYHRKEK